MSLQYRITHIFCPPKLPDGDDHSHSNDLALSEAVCDSAFEFSGHLHYPAKAHWESVKKLLHNLYEAMDLQQLEETLIASQLESMAAGDVIAYLIRAQNAAVIFRRGSGETIAESFEVSPSAEAVMGCRGKLVCSYPGPAIAIPDVVFNDAVFRLELAHFLCEMDRDSLDAAPTSRKGGSTISEERDTVHPRYITELLTGILRAVGRPAEVQRISKRIGDDVVWRDSRLPWRRSSLWLMIRVVLQTTLERSDLGFDGYKAFMLFFMNGLASEALHNRMPDDILHWVSAKISRRLTKLGKPVPDWLSEAVLQTCTNIRNRLDSGWKQVQDRDAFSPTWKPFYLNFLADTQLCLLDSHKYISDTLNSSYSTIQPDSYVTGDRLRGTLDSFLSMIGDFFEGTYKADPRVTHYDVERVVRDDIDDWVTGVPANDIAVACEKLELLASKYSSGARETYKDNPEDFSRMVLTVIEVWVAIDKLVMRQIPMLREYSPEVPITLLERLLLRDAHDIQRLCLASDYIRKRHSGATNGWSVFSDRADSNSFAVRYFNQDVHLQDLMTHIVKVARQERQEKVLELKQSNERYHDITRRAADMVHDYRGSWKKKHLRRKCAKCKLESQSKIEITVHEWPLPEDPCRAAIVVFELNCPLAFDMWRSVIYLLLVDICSPRSLNQRHPHTCLGEYSALWSYHTKHARSRITLASDAKPFVKSHYRSTSIPTVESRVCVNNGLSFYYYDKNSHVSAAVGFDAVDISGPCSHQLPSGPYQNLQRYIQYTAHTSNDVLCSQTNCDKDLSTHEFVAYGHLRSGPSLQWLNILREIHANTFTLRRDEVHVLFAQAASQVGPVSDDGKLVWHVELERPRFRHSLLDELETLVSTVSGNWLEGATMETISFLTARMLSVTFAVQDHSYHRALELLRAIREKTFCWVLELLDKLEQTVCEIKKEQFRGRLRDLAAICRSTFDVGLDDAKQLLDSSRALEILVCCAIVIHDNTPSQFCALVGMSRLLVERDCRLSWKLEELLGNIMLEGNDGIDLGIKRIWPGYRRGTRWQKAGTGKHTWFTAKTSSSGMQWSQQVCFDVLNGTLLVDGRPIRRLPDEIRTDPVFTLLFGAQILDVLPSDMVGMVYATRGLIDEYRVYFRMGINGLIVRAKKEIDPNIFELIPSHKLGSDLPIALVENHVHWFNLTTRMMEARPVETLWKSSPDNWRLHFSPGGHSMTKGDARLFDVRSHTWQMLSKRLQPLENPQNLIITLQSSNTVSVDLPRYGLSFFINDDKELECRHPRGMVYDECQSAGTLIGLATKLVLRPKANLADEGARRLILVPEGNVSFARQGDHVQVTIDISGPAQKRFQYQIFHIDTDSGCLIGNATLTSNLYRAYLHALTSKPSSVDPLTQRTGTEEALSILCSAACRSFMKVDARSAKLLCCIAGLTTRRTWYPKHLKCMQNVHWLGGVPVTSQHCGFYVACSSIKEIQEQLQPFHDVQFTPLFEDFPPACGDDLLLRAAVRAAVLYPQTLYNPLLGGGYDSVYKARDILLPSTDEHRVYNTALAVYNWSVQQCSPKKSLGLVKSWNGIVQGVSQAFPLRYNKDWLSPDLPGIWLSLYDSCRKSRASKHRFQLIFSLSAMAYTSQQLEVLAGALLAFATIPQFREEDPPDHPTYDLSDGYRPSPHALTEFVSRCTKPRWYGISLEEYMEQRDQEKDKIIAELTASWPCMQPPSDDFRDCSWHDIDALDSDLSPLFASCYRNLELKNHLNRVESIFGEETTSSLTCSDDKLASPTVERPAYSFTPPSHGHHRANWAVTLEVLFHRAAPVLPINLVTPQNLGINRRSQIRSRKMSQLIRDLHRNANSTFRATYANELQQSADHLRCDQMGLEADALVHLVESFRTHYEQSRTRHQSTLRFLTEYLGPQTTNEHAAHRSGQWPRITVKVLLGCLASNSKVPLPPDWRVCLIEFAKLVLEYQRARRMLALVQNGQVEDLHKEMENVGCDGWEAESYTDWLLIQLDGDFLVRRVQADVALEMITPRSGQNTVLQLNMGEGKSSVIVPAAASVLADGNQLVRVVVPKALASQMFHLLVDRLGGLVNRRIFYLPFSRSLQIDQSGAQAVQAILKRCMRDRGILVVQPEHILSFKLLSIEKQLGDTTDIGGELLQTQRWLHSHARDILDESDEVLHIRNQLIYAIGSQKPLEGSPTRWSTTQQILHLVKKHAAMLHVDSPRGVEYEQCHHPSGAFPHIRILHREAGNKLIFRIAQDVVDGRLLNFKGTRGIERTAIHHFITRMDVASSEVQMIRNYCGGTAMWMTLLHLRGLLASGILLFALMERRWRVGYGLAPSRTMLAVPYRAKDVPAPRAEFGHPDVAIVLTSLSYYYGGLNEEQLMICFERLLTLDNPDQEYESWVRDCLEVPVNLRQMSGINTQSLVQWNQHLVPIFSRNQSTVDFYLSQVVFPKAAKEFPSKLSSCGWDLAEKKEHVTTGFSGTNDARYLLPTSTIQRDPDHQRATNAKVLDYLLRPENDAYVQTSWPDGRRRTADEFLALVVEQAPEIRVILDVGAQVLELQNNELAALWLQLKPDALAAIYFNDDHELTVLSREETTQSLLESPYASRLDECVVYLDDAHTRGTDIKFPIDFRAAVTLGPKVTKDRLTQGCMRMRRLGHGHSVMFFGPLEVDRNIRDAARKSDADMIHPSDILLWAMGETCTDIENTAPYWAQQGRDHYLRYSAWSKFCSGEITSQGLAATWRQPDAKTLEELYAPSHPMEQLTLSIPEIDQRCQQLGVSSSTNSNMSEEQEREIIHEIEHERQVERPPPATPAVHRVPADVRNFVRTGMVIPHSTAFILLFDSFRGATPLPQENNMWSRHILATSDYCTVVQGQTKVNVGEHLRPVNWILSSQSNGNSTLVILSPFEVNELISEIRNSGFVCLHIYTPRTQARMHPCDDLRLYTIPSAPSDWTAPISLVDQVNLFAGQLYLRNYDTYIRLCRFLCIYADDLAGEGELKVENDGFIAPAHRPLNARLTGSFQKSPLAFLKHVFNLRRRGMNFVVTHMGRILNGRLLKEEDFKDH